jgi:hypothetical protein
VADVCRLLLLVPLVDDFKLAKLLLDKRELNKELLATDEIGLELTNDDCKALDETTADEILTDELIIEERDIEEEAVELPVTLDDMDGNDDKLDKGADDIKRDDVEAVEDSDPSMDVDDGDGDDDTEADNNDETIDEEGDDELLSCDDADVAFDETIDDFVAVDATVDIVNVMDDMDENAVEDAKPLEYDADDVGEGTGLEKDFELSEENESLVDGALLLDAIILITDDIELKLAELEKLELLRIEDFCVEIKFNELEETKLDGMPMDEEINEAETDVTEANLDDVADEDGVGVIEGCFEDALRLEKIDENELKAREEETPPAVTLGDEIREELSKLLKDDVEAALNALLLVVAEFTLELGAREVLLNKLDGTRDDDGDGETKLENELRDDT